MKVVVVGAGQMGGIYGAAAHENGHEVLFVDASRISSTRSTRTGSRSTARTEAASTGSTPPPRLPRPA
jgi:prephenate dehydrogenase